MVKYWSKAKTSAPDYLTCYNCGVFHDRTNPVRVLHRIDERGHVKHASFCKKCAKHQPVVWRACGCGQYTSSTPGR